MIEINFSVFAEPIKTQLENQGYTLSDKESEKFQKIAKSINCMLLIGYPRNLVKQFCCQKNTLHH